jgi:hypothetical protein
MAKIIDETPRPTARERVQQTADAHGSFYTCPNFRDPKQ